METIGNKEILKLPKTAFLCSRNVSASVVLKCYDWATEQRDAGHCVISGFHSQLEKDVLHFLLKGTQLEKERSKKTEKTITSSPKSSLTGLMVTFPNGKVVNNRYAYETLIEVVETVGVQKVVGLGIKHVGLDFITKTKDDFYNQHELADGYLILTHSSTDKKKRQLEEISTKLGLGLKVEVVYYIPNRLKKTC